MAQVPSETCNLCFGTGTFNVSDYLTRNVVSRTCSDCHGTGRREVRPRNNRELGRLTLWQAWATAVEEYPEDRNLQRCYVVGYLGQALTDWPEKLA